MGIQNNFKSGQPARLFPVLSNKSKEIHTTSIMLSTLSMVHEFSDKMLSSVKQRVGTRATLTNYTEVVFESSSEERPDGLIILKNRGKTWSALIETKIANNKIDADQVERYRTLAKQNNIDCVITISNQFTVSPDIHPDEAVRKSRSKIPIFHWSWTYIRTAADLLIQRDEIQDPTQLKILEEFRRFLVHESTGVKGFDTMPADWAVLNKNVAAGGHISARSPEASAVMDAWHQETKDVSLLLSRRTEAHVTEKLTRKYQNDHTLRVKDELAKLSQEKELVACFSIPNAAAPLDVSADIAGRTVNVGMTLSAPGSKKTTKARINWLLKQVRSENTDDLFVKLFWPGSRLETVCTFDALRANPERPAVEKSKMQVRQFHLYYSKDLGAKFTQPKNFIKELEELIPLFYKEIGQHLKEWRPTPPKIHAERIDAKDDIEAV